MKIFKALKRALYEGNDRIPLKMVQADSVDGKLRLSSSNGHCLVSCIFKKIKNDKFYYITSSVVSKLAKDDKFKFKNGRINEYNLIEDGGKIKVCDTKTTVGSCDNKKAEQRFPVVDNVIPTCYRTKFTLDRLALFKAIKNEEYVSFKITDKSLYVFSSKYKHKLHKIVKSSKPKTVIPTKCLIIDSEDVVHFNASILKAVLCIPCDKITIGFNNRVTALGIYYEDEYINIKNLAMPVISRD